MRLTGKNILVYQSSSHLLFQANKILGMDSLLKAFLPSRVSSPFALARASPGQLGRGLKFNEKYLSFKQGSKPTEILGIRQSHVMTLQLPRTSTLKAKL